MMPNLTRTLLLRLYHRLYKAYGAQGWWPAETRFEVMVGAILTQNTSWHNVEQAIHRLRQADALNCHAILNKSEAAVADLIRPSGYFNVKSKRLKCFVQWFVEHGKYRRLALLSDVDLRAALLGVYGIGPETADDILLYAFSRPVFVIDTYTRRLLSRLDLIVGDEDYMILSQGFKTALGADVALFNEYHALFVRHAKEACLQQPGCGHCAVEAPLVGAKYMEAS